MNLVGGYQHHHHHHHHHHMLHDPFLFGPAARCHQERAYFPGWVLNPPEVTPELAGQSPSYGPADPTAPADTKLSKIKPLRLATSYIAYLMEVLAKDSQPGDTEGFKAELKKADGRENKRKRETQPEVYSQPLGHGEKKLKGRTGWPQQVWALELNP
ncbi:HAND1 protein, partial [Ibidorhyncha struthersii]|nr:HAND1 protein [Ibidorhyncha struthersii]